MKDTDEDTIWEISPHTAAKHHILRRYLEAWAPILLQSYNSTGVLYIDGFAGPGEYMGKERGSPIIALDSIMNHVRKSNFKGTIRFVFIEQREDRSRHLKEVIESKYPKLPEGISCKVKQGEFNQIIKEVIDKADMKGINLPPCFCFVDPFGWRDLNYEVLAKIMKYPKAELFITFMAGFLNRFKESEQHRDSLSKLYSDKQIEQMSDPSISNEERPKLVLKMFIDNLKIQINKFTQEKILDFSFSAYNGTGNLSYYLIHLTKSCKGIEVMKKAMFDVKKDGEYSFSDFGFVPGQTTLVSYFNEELWVVEAAKDVFEYFKRLFRLKSTDHAEKKLPVDIVKYKINCYTKWVYKASILSHLESQGKIEYKNNRKQNRKRGQFPEPGGYILFKF